MYKLFVKLFINLYNSLSPTQTMLMGNYKPIISNLCCINLYLIKIKKS